MTRKFMLTIVAAVVAVATTPIAHVIRAQTPQRDASAASLIGTASITGIVVTDDADARPVRMAMISVQATGTSPVTSTDDSGRFVIARLPAGRYSISASKAGFVRTTYGAKRPGGSGVPVILADGGRANITVRLARGAAISGTVRSATGDPIANASVNLGTYGYQ